MPYQTLIEYTREDSELKRNWLRFDLENPHVYELLKKFTFQVIKAGRTHYAVKAIFERIRWHTAIETNDPDFKINNNHAPFYARKFHREFPEHDGFFRTRVQKADPIKQL